MSNKTALMPTVYQQIAPGLSPAAGNTNRWVPIWSLSVVR
jgi:hypothetical protein